MIEEDVQKKLDDVHNVLDSLRFMRHKYEDYLPKEAFNSEIAHLEELRNQYSEMIYPSC